MAALLKRDPLQSWVVEVFRQLPHPLLTCEPVLTEAAYFLRDAGLDVDPLFDLVDRSVLKLSFDVASSWPRMRALMARYERMDFADAAVVVMSEQHKRCQVLTVDARDFRIYRRHDRQVIPTITPPPTR